FETYLKGKTVGDEFDFSVPSDEAYGPINEEAVVAVDRNNLNFPTKEQEDEMLQIGRTLPMQDQEGNPLNGLIQEITEEYVRMDFNHPLAGVNLHFSGKVLEVREASQEEIEHGHVHGQGGHQH
nr:peptidylprolyl isomerase [Flammeovirgaceae bacterium]